MDKKNKNPEIRFKGFTDDWKKKDLEEVGGFKNGMNFGKEAMGHGHPFVNLQNVFGKNVVDDTKLELAVSNENQRKDYSLEKGDVLFIRSSVKPEGVGETAIIIKNLRNTTYSGFIIRFRPIIEMNENFNRFVYSTNKIRKQILQGATSSANTNINQESLKKIKIIFPDVKEQFKIGNYFNKIDQIITLRQHKYDKLVNMKKAMLEKMFPKNGADVPEIRFKGFTEAWGKCELGDVTDSYSGGTPSVGIEEYYNGKIPFIRSGELNSDSTELFITEKGLNNSSAKLVDIGTILYAMYGATSGEVGRARIKGAINQAILAIIPKHNYDAEFIMQWLRKMKRAIVSTYLQGGQGNLSGGIVKDLNIDLPCFEEQKLIGTFFKKIDNLIVFHEHELKKLKNIKKACLGKMFV